MLEIGRVRIDDGPGPVLAGCLVEQLDLRVHRDDVCLNLVRLDDIGALEQRVEHFLIARVAFRMLFEACDIEFGELVNPVSHDSLQMIGLGGVANPGSPGA
ncbi:hypothetical protein DO70_4846 [Burkholderia pseudomallei]|nr:hypothetical protein DO70_4846 [Burkholderia pseudomallei]